MTDYKKYINALRECAKEHEGDRTSTGQIVVSNLCRDTAELLEGLEQQPCEDAISRADAVRVASGYCHPSNIAKELAKLPPVQPEIIRCKDCKHFAGEWMYCACDIIVQFDHFYCYHAERRQDV